MYFFLKKIKTKSYLTFLDIDAMSFSLTKVKMEKSPGVHVLGDLDSNPGRFWFQNTCPFAHH